MLQSERRVTFRGSFCWESIWGQNSPLPSMVAEKWPCLKGHSLGEEWGIMRPYCGRKANSFSKTDWPGFYFLSHCFISTSLSVSLILYFSFWQVNQAAVAKSSIVHGTLAIFRRIALHESSLATLVPFCPGCRLPRGLQLLVTMNTSLWFCSQNVTVTDLQVACCYRCWHRFPTIMLPVLIFS